MEMGLFDKLFKKPEPEKPSENKKPNADISQMLGQIALGNADTCMMSGDYEQAYKFYKSAAETLHHADAFYNLGSMSAQGKGTAKDFVQAAYWFSEAAKLGDGESARLINKCFMDYLHDDFDASDPLKLFQKSEELLGRVNPGEDVKKLCGDKLYSLGKYHFDKEEYVKALKLFRSAAQYCGDGPSQNMLGVMYNLGIGTEHNDMNALYWFDLAADNGIDAARTDREGILNAYRKNLSEQDFKVTLNSLKRACFEGTADIPANSEKADYWAGRISG